MPRKKQPHQAPVEVRRLERELKSWKRKYRTLEEEYFATLDTRELIAEALGGVTIPTVPKRKRPAKHHRDEVTAGMPQADWHTGLVVKGSEIQHYNSYDWEISQSRRSAAMERFLRWIDLHRKAYSIRDVSVPSLGDWIDGTIHVENLMFNEFSAPEAAVRAGEALAQLLRTLCTNFDKVYFDGISGNHDRLFKKPLYTGQARYAWTVVVYETARALTTGCRNLSFVAHPGMKADVWIGDSLFLCEHGQAVRAYMGMPFYGLDRLTSREANRRAQEGKPPIDYHMFGHWHTLEMTGQRVLCPSLCGTTPYDHQVGRHGPPGQLAFLVGPRGVFDWLCIDLSGDGSGV